MKKRFLLFITLGLAFSQSLTAQEVKKYEFGASAAYGIGLGEETLNSYKLDLSAGYKIDEHFSAGVGLGYRYAGQPLLPSNIENVYIWGKNYQSFRAFLYGRYNFLPEKKWTPFVSAQLGYAFFKNSTISYHINPFALFPEGQIMYGEVDVDVSEYEYLKDLDNTLVIKNRVFGSLDIGMSRKIGRHGGALSFGVFLDVQPARFEYNKTSHEKVYFSVGPKLGYTF